jgi:ribonuclease HII
LRENLDLKLWRSNALLCGVDEVGRGALAGPVVAAAVVLPAGAEIDGADDSKKLSAAQRQRLDCEIRLVASAVSLGSASPAYIDRHNIRLATFHAMRLVVNRLKVRPQLVLADGWAIPELDVPCEGVIQGDCRSLSIACASIIAKVYRDQLMERLSHRYPGYALHQHKGYGTPAHIAAIHQLGPSPIHRRSFAPIRSSGAGSC